MANFFINRLPNLKFGALPISSIAILILLSLGVAWQLAMAASGAESSTESLAEGKLSGNLVEHNQLTVKRQAVADLKSLFAMVQTVDVTTARARIGGTLVELLVDEGDTVEAGQKLARVRDPKQRLQIAATESKLRSLQAQLKLARTTLKRVSKLYASGKISEAKQDEAQTRVDVVSADIAALKSDQAVIRQAQIEGDVLAPATGRVLNVGVTQGAVVLPGEPIAQIAAESYILRLTLPERHARFIKEGDTILVGDRGMLDVEFEATNSRRRDGLITQVYPELDNGRVVADVSVAGLGDFFVGERIRVWVATGQRQAFVIPMEYLHRRYGLSYVRLVNGIEIVVQPGIPVEGAIEILSGLREGDVLIRQSTEIGTEG